MTNRQAVYEVLDSYNSSILSGWGLFDLVYFKTGRRPYPPRLLEYARDWADASGGGFDCVDRAKSLYKVTHGHPIAGAIMD